MDGLANGHISRAVHSQQRRLMKLAKSLEDTLRGHSQGTAIRLLPSWPALCATDSHRTVSSPASPHSPFSPQQSSSLQEFSDTIITASPRHPIARLETPTFSWEQLHSLAAGWQIPSPSDITEGGMALSPPGPPPPLGNAAHGPISPQPAAQESGASILAADLPLVELQGSASEPADDLQQHTATLPHTLLSPAPTNKQLHHRPQGATGTADMLPSPAITPRVPTLLPAEAAQGTLPPLALGPRGLALPAFALGLPARPLLTAACQALAAWVLTGSFPFPQVEQLTPDLLSESAEYHEKKAWLHLQVLRLLPSGTLDCLTAGPLDTFSGSLEQHLNWDALLAILSDPQAVLILLGFRITTGTTRDLTAVPGLVECVDAFGALHAPASKSKLTTGARALSKHCHRDSSAFWGDPRGPERVKDGLAADVLLRLLRGAVWVNLHYLPPDKHVLELRVQQGYGARWEVCNLLSGPSGAAASPLAPHTVHTVQVAVGNAAPGQDDPSVAPDNARPSSMPGSDGQGLPLRLPPATAGVASQVWTSPAGSASSGGGCTQLSVKFRGFLEPQLPDGHELGWRH